MTNFLTAVKTVTLNQKPVLEEAAPPVPPARSEDVLKSTSVTSPEDVLQILRSQPDRDILRHVLRYLHRDQAESRTFDVRRPSPIAAKIIHELVSTTVRDFWEISRTTEKNGHKAATENELIVSCLKHVAGIAAVIARLRLLTTNAPTGEKLALSDQTQELRTLISLLSTLLHGHDVVSQIWAGTVATADSATQRKLLWKEVVNLMSSGKIISAIAQAEDVSPNSPGIHPGSWLARGSDYAAWLGKNIAELMQRQQSEQGWTEVALLFSKALTLGHSPRLVECLYQSIARTGPEKMELVHQLAIRLSGQDQRRFIEQTLQYSSSHFGLQDATFALNTTRGIKCASALITGLIGQNKSLLDKLCVWLSDPATYSASSLHCRRAALVSVKCDNDRMESVMETNMKLFGDNLFIRHTPIMQQEACAEMLLLSAGYVHRAQPMFLFTMARSSIHMNGVSNRLNSSSPKARALGMCVGMAISGLVDKEGQKMVFDVDDAKNDDAQALLQLVHADDIVGSAEDVYRFETEKNVLLDNVKTAKVSATKQSRIRSKQIATVSGIKSASTPRVIEVLTDSEDDDDLVPYAKPDSDPDDEDEDPTVINRNKPRPPVYIRDLLAGLQDTENHDRHCLALKTAAPLIRRKAGFGKEVSNHAMELSTILAGLGDTFDMEDFAELRLQALIALLISDTTTQAPRFARQVFEGDYSLSQRATLLSAMGLSARELAGYKDEDVLNPPVVPSNSFPSKRLPERYHQMYTTGKAQLGQNTTAVVPPPANAVQALSSQLETSLVQPLALQAADAQSGPSALKVRTFSSRMQVAKRTKKIPNTLAQTLAESFFFPLTGHWSAHAQAYGSARNIHFQPFLLSTFLKTLALLLHASGPGTVSLPQLTAEFWDLLLGVRTIAAEDVAVLEAVLFALLTLLEVNEDKRRVAEEHARQLVETQEWAEGVFERTAGGDQEGERVRMLAASVLLKTREVVEKYQRLLVGDMMDY